MFPEHVIKFGPWSISKAGTREKCSLQFNYAYGPNKTKGSDTFNESRIGVAVHYALELALGDVRIKRSFLMSSDKFELTTDEIDQLNAFHEQVDRFQKKMVDFRKKYGVTAANRFIERKWRMRHDFTKCNFFDGGGDCTNCGYVKDTHKENRCQVGGTVYNASPPVFFRGVVDYGLLTASRDLIIIDHKSGKEKELSYYEPQFKAYCLLALAHIPDLRGVQTAVNFIMTDNVVWNKYVKAETIREEYKPWLVDFLTKSCTKLLQPPAPSKGWWCNWCGYKSICPAFGGNRGHEEINE